MSKALEGLGFVGDAVQSAGVLVDWAKAQEGLRYSPHVFSFPEPKSKQQKIAPKDPKETELKTAKLDAPKIPLKPQTMWALPAWLENPQYALRPVLSLTLAGKNLPSKPGHAIARFGVVLRRALDRSTFQHGQTALYAVQGFDSALGSQLEIQFSGVEWSDVGYLLTLYGQLNPLEGALTRFEGAIAIGLDGKMYPQGFAYEGVSSKPDMGWNRAVARLHFGHDVEGWEPEYGYVINR